MSKLVWAFRPLPELESRTGFVTCDDDIADRLLAADLVQDPRIGANACRNITDEPPPATHRQSTVERVGDPSEYDTKVMRPKSRK